MSEKKTELKLLEIYRAELYDLEKNMLQHLEEHKVRRNFIKRHARKK